MQYGMSSGLSLRIFKRKPDNLPCPKKAVYCIGRLNGMNLGLSKNEVYISNGHQIIRKQEPGNRWILAMSPIHSVKLMGNSDELRWIKMNSGISVDDSQWFSIHNGVFPLSPALSRRPWRCSSCRSSAKSCVAWRSSENNGARSWRCRSGRIKFQM